MPNGLGIALSGGGAKGSFQVGVLEYIYDNVLPARGEDQPSVVSGTSVGAINAVKIAEGGRDAFDGLKRIWTERMLGDLDMWNFEPQFDDFEKSIKNQILNISNWTVGTATGIFRFTITSLGGGLVLGPAGLGLGALINYLSLQSELDQFKDQIENLAVAVKKSKSFLNINPIKQMLSDVNFLNPQRVENSGIALRLAAVSLDTGQIWYMHEDGVMRSDTGEFAAPLNDGVLASAAAPVAFPPVKLGTEWFVDGGVRELVPIYAAALSRPDQLIAVLSDMPVLPRSFDDQARASQGQQPANIEEIADRALLQILFDELGNDDAYVGSTRAPQVRDLVLLRPSVAVHDSLTIDPGLIDVAIAHGYMVAFDQLDGPTRLTPLHLRKAVELNRSITQKRVDAIGHERRLSEVVAEVEQLLVERGGVEGLAVDPALADHVRQRLQIIDRDISIKKNELTEIVPALRGLKRSIRKELDRRRSLGAELYGPATVVFLDFERIGSDHRSPQEFGFSLWGAWTFAGLSFAAESSPNRL